MSDVYGLEEARGHAERILKAVEAGGMVDGPESSVRVGSDWVELIVTWEAYTDE